MNSPAISSHDAGRGAAPARGALRRDLRARRRALAPGEHRRLSHSLCRNIAGWPVFRRARRFAFYLSNDGEPDLGTLLERAWLMGKQAYLPALNRRSLWFLPLEADAPMSFNRFGIAEPTCAPGTRVKPYSLDLVLVPLVAFDPSGARLGMGGGFYDRSFAYLNHRTRWRRPRLVGVAFDFQRVEEIPVKPWDVRLDAVITERGLLLPGAAAATEHS